MTTIVTRGGKGSALTWVEADANFTNLNNDKIESTLTANIELNGNHLYNSSTLQTEIDLVSEHGNIYITSGHNNVFGGTPVTTNITLDSNYLYDSNSYVSIDNLRYPNQTEAIAVGTGAVLTYQNSRLELAQISITESQISDLQTYLTSVSQDTNPTLGGNLDVLSNTISSSTGIVNIADEIKASKFNIDTTVTSGSTAIGQIAYNDVDGCLEYIMKGGNVNLQIGQEEVVRIHNNTGSTLTDGQIVYISGSTGTLPTVALAQANAEATSYKTIGMVTESITNGAAGFITVSGLVHGLNTNAYNSGDQVWLSPTTAGGWSTTRPTAPHHSVFIGWIVQKSGGNGSILIHIENGQELDELHDVYINTLADGQLLKYNNTNSRWENFSPSYLSSSDIGSTVQGYDSDLTSWAAITPSSKQDTLVSGTNLKSINSTSLLGSGNISVQDVLVSGTSIKTINGNDILGAGNIVISSGQGLGSIVAYKADGSQDNIDITANTTLTQVGITQELLLDASSLIAIETTSSYGWRDNIAPFVVKSTTGTNNPSWASLWSGFEGLVFSATAMNQVWVDFHIDHDYALGTTLYPHVHWTPTTTGTGTVRWGIEYSVAKGHQQGATSTFPTSTTVYVEQTISTNSQWQHFVAEVSDANAIPSTNVEPDSVIKVRIFRDAAHANDTYAGTVHAWQSDLHYKSNRWATLNKAPNFNA